LAEIGSKLIFVELGDKKKGILFPFFVPVFEKLEFAAAECKSDRFGNLSGSFAS